MSRLLAIDVGERRIGLALADTDTGSVRPLATIRRVDAARDAATLTRLAAEQRVVELVVGLPLNADGSEGEQASRTRGWAEAIERLTRLPVGWRDERLTSERAEALAGKPGRGRSGGPPSPAARAAYRARIDRLAAAGIAQAELDARAAADAGASRGR
ncbi:MAG TPA: Holliday junction resolvase RuvX [Candidatus Limnocylindrales bacterium]|nr:Holliday junction resolvase RuvX [Candidatus Limnocylindrales bacterium]